MTYFRSSSIIICCVMETAPSFSEVRFRTFRFHPITHRAEFLRFPRTFIRSRTSLCNVVEPPSVRTCPLSRTPSALACAWPAYRLPLTGTRLSTTQHFRTLPTLTLCLSQLSRPQGWQALLDLPHTRIRKILSHVTHSFRRRDPPVPVRYRRERRR